jgi:hypothetical protein
MPPIDLLDDAVGIGVQTKGLGLRLCSPRYRLIVVLATAEGCGTAEIMRRAGVSQPDRDIREKSQRTIEAAMTTTGRALADSTAIQGFSDEAKRPESQTGGIHLPLREYFILVIREVAEQFTGKKRGPSGTRQGNLETKLVNETPTQSRKVFRYQCLTICLIFRQNLKTLGTAHD